MFVLPSSSVFPRRCRHGASQSGQRTAQRSTGRRSWLWRRRKGPTANECGRPRKPRDSRTGLTLRAPAGTGPADTPILPQRASTSAQNCEMITRVALSHQVCDSVPQRPPDSPPQARTRPHPRPPLPGKDDPVLGLDGPPQLPNSDFSGARSGLSAAGRWPPTPLAKVYLSDLLGDQALRTSQVLGLKTWAHDFGSRAPLALWKRSEASISRLSLGAPPPYTHCCLLTAPPRHTW